jgi:hypothetical protein
MRWRAALALVVLSGAAYAQSADGVLTAARKHLRVGDGVEETIATGAITAGRTRIRIDTEADAGTDDLDTLTGVEGQIYFLTPEDGARSVVIKHQTGNIECPGATDIPLAEDDDFAIGLYTGGKLIVLWQRLLAGNVGNAGGGACPEQDLWCDQDLDGLRWEYATTSECDPGAAYVWANENAIDGKTDWVIGQCVFYPGGEPDPNPDCNDTVFLGGCDTGCEGC